MRISPLFISALLFVKVNAGTDSSWITTFERSGGKASAAYEEVQAYYERLDKNYEEVTKLSSDVALFHGRGRTVYRISRDINENKQEKLRIFINNAIHAGEPDGVDACMMLLRDLLQRKEYKELLNHVELYVIPVYNVDGFIERGCCSRANQNGPESYGFRANGQNYDLNRDFIKADAPETHFFQSAFRSIKPHIFIDTHVSNGADYQYVMTYIAAHRAKLHPAVGDLMYGTLIPALEKSFKKKGPGLAPYVNVFGAVPDSGYHAFFESPRYASGYATLFNAMGFVTETHMLKPFKERVIATYDFILEMMRAGAANKNSIVKAKGLADKQMLEQNLFPLAWKHDTVNFEWLNFKGYAAAYKASAVSGQQRLFYDRTRPYEKKIRYYSTYVAAAEVSRPKAYLIPVAYRPELEGHLKRNNISYTELVADSLFTGLGVYYIGNYQTTSRPYEGHYLHYAVQLKKDTMNVMLRKGSLIVPTAQDGARYLLETFEPNASDAFFAWNYFDAILQQKEHYSDYVWDDRAAELLEADARLRGEFEKKKKEDPSFAGDARAQLDFIYHNSIYFEPGFMRYPLFRIEF